MEGLLFKKGRFFGTTEYTESTEEHGVKHACGVFILPQLCVPLCPLFLCGSKKSAEFVFFNFSVKCGKPDIEQPGSFCFIAFCVVEDTLYVQFFYTGE